MYILGISAFYHDSAACLIKDGEILSASHEERFSRIKNDAGFPIQSIDFCLNKEKITLKNIEYITFYDKPFLKFERILETYLAYAPMGLKSFLFSIPIWIKEKLFTKKLIKRKLAKFYNIKIKDVPTLLFSEHHQSHAASAFFPSPYSNAMVLCIDGVGEWATTTLWQGKDNQLSAKWQINFPHSLGLIYSAFTSFCGFKVNSGEYKLMGLAPYGEAKYKDLIYKNLIDVKNDGSFHINMEYFNYANGLTMTNSKFNNLFSTGPRHIDSEMTQIYMDLAKSIQEVIEEVIFKIVKNIHNEYGGENLCLAGGVALNCVSNGKLLQHGPYPNIWVQPAAGDAGGSIGAALATWYEFLKQKRTPDLKDSMKGAFLGQSYELKDIQSFLDENNIIYTQYSGKEHFSQIAKYLKNKKVIGLFQGKTEFGPRALGSRSIIADPRDADMQSVLNLKIKKRESFRPFAPAVLEEFVSTYFSFTKSSSYMQFVSDVNSESEKLPAITHVDGSARLQTVNSSENPYFYNLINEFYQQTECPVLINTSFNVRGEPIVNSPQDAYNCFMNTEMDVLILENFCIKKEDNVL